MRERKSARGFRDDRPSDSSHWAKQRRLPYFISPPHPAPHNRSPRFDLTRHQTLDMISSLLRLGKVCRREFMELARLAVQSDAKLAPIIADWDRMKPPLQ